MVPPERRMRAAGAKLEHDREVSYMLINDPAREVTVQPGAVVSKVVHRGDGLNVTVFAFDAGEQLTEHQAARTAVVQVLSGHLRFTVDAEELDLDPGSWLHMAPGAPHSLIATEPTVMLLTLIGE
jgi:quercetin dioxygenase-like cupin family protein